MNYINKIFKDDITLNIYGNKLKVQESLEKLLNKDTNIGYDYNDFQKMINNKANVFVKLIDEIDNVFIDFLLTNKNKILIHFLGNFWLSETTNLLDKFNKDNNLNIEFTISESQERIVVIYAY